MIVNQGMYNDIESMLIDENKEVINFSDHHLIEVTMKQKAKSLGVTRCFGKKNSVIAEISHLHPGGTTNIRTGIIMTFIQTQSVLVQIWFM